MLGAGGGSGGLPRKLDGLTVAVKEAGWCVWLKELLDALDPNVTVGDWSHNRAGSLK